MGRRDIRISPGATPLLVPTLCVGTGRGDAPRRGPKLRGVLPGRTAALPSRAGRHAERAARAFPRRAWERGEARGLAFARPPGYTRRHVLVPLLRPRGPPPRVPPRRRPEPVRPRPAGAGAGRRGA